MIKRLLLAGCMTAISQLNFGQTAEMVLQKFELAKKSIHTIRYQVHRIDSFPSGSVWDHRGYCTMKRRAEDTLFGFFFKAKRDDIATEVIFNGSECYFVDHTNKKFTIEREPHRGIIGSPGGQMVFEALLPKKEAFEKISLTTTDSCHILRFNYPDDKEYKIEKRYRILYISRKTYLPFYSYQHAERAGQENISISRLSNIVVNEKNYYDPFINKDYLRDYTLEEPSVNDTQVFNRLLNKPAPDFELTGVDGNQYKLSDHRDKVILLDFWETWCSPCIKSLPKLKAMASKFSNENVAFWSVVSDAKTFDKVKSFVSRQQLNYPVLFGTPETAKDYFVFGVPMYILIDKQGTVRFVKYGYSESLEEEVRKYL